MDRIQEAAPPVGISPQELRAAGIPGLPVPGRFGDRPAQETRIEPEIDAVEQFLSQLYNLTEEDIRIVEEATHS